jgi:hypothetical protein
MTILTSERLSPVSLHLRQGDARQEKALMLRRGDDCFTVTYDPGRISLDAAAMLARSLFSSEGKTVFEVVLEGHSPDLTAVYHAASKLLLDVEITSGPKITQPTVKVLSKDPTTATYFIPEGWNLADALDRLPTAFADARPKVARSLERIEQAKRDSGGVIDHALDVVAALVLETDDPSGVFEQMLRVFQQEAGHATPGVPTSGA